MIDWNSFLMGTALGIVAAIIPCIWMAKKEHQEAMELLGCSIVLTEEWKKKYETLKGDECD